jgi:predicted transcriptional regulator
VVQIVHIQGLLTALQIDKVIRVKFYHMNSKPRVSKIAANLKRLKREKKLSQSSLCRKSGLAYHTIAKIETGTTSDPRISTLKKLAYALGVSLDDLVK